MVAQRQYEYGTSPRKLKPQEMPKRENKAKDKKKNMKVNKKVILLHKIKIFVCIAIFFGIIFGISYRYSLINQKYNKVRSLKKEYTDLQATNTQITIGIQNSLDLTKIERHAKDKLGMQKPLASQIKYLDIKKEDKVELNEDVVTKTNAFQNFFNGITKVLD